MPFRLWKGLYYLLLPLLFLVMVWSFVSNKLRIAYVYWQGNECVCAGLQVYLQVYLW